jgi:hypothetical protein
MPVWLPRLATRRRWPQLKEQKKGIFPFFPKNQSINLGKKIFKLIFRRTGFYIPIVLTLKDGFGNLEGMQQAEVLAVGVSSLEKVGQKQKEIFFLSGPVFLSTQG